MNDPAAFDCDHFLSLTGGELFRYAEPFVSARPGVFPDSVNETLLDRLGVMDDEHTVYAMEICMLLRPGEFLHRLVDFLSDEDSAVCCTAYRLFKSFPAGLLPAHLMAAVAATPSVDLFAHDVHSGARIQIGTNEAFLRDLAGVSSRKMDAAG